MDQRSPAGVGLLLVALFQLGDPQGSVQGHEIGEKLVHHQLIVEVGRRNIDAFLEVRLQAEPALRERKRIDADGDGQITPEEEKYYRRELGEAVKREFSIHIAGDRLPTLPLFHPELDLQGARQVESSPLTIQLSFFARAPADLSGLILIQGGFQRWQPAAHAVRARGRERMEAWALPLSRPVSQGKGTIYRIWGQPQPGWEIPSTSPGLGP